MAIRLGLLALGALGLVAGFAGIRRLAEQLTADDLRGELALVTGGSRGLGLLLARELSHEGCRVVICARDPDELEEARRWLAGDAAEVATEVCDVADIEQVDRLVASVTGRFGPIDLLVNNAGIISVGELRTMSLHEFRHAHDVMFYGVLHPTLAVLPSMRRRRRGRIVNITSIGGRVSVPHLVAYSSAKFAAVGLSEGLRSELGRDGIHVTTVVPGLMRTGSYVRAMYKQPHAAEFGWFSLGASLPIISMDAERAARQIVGAIRRRSAVCTIGPPALALATFHGLFPGLTADLLGLVSRLLPHPADDDLREPAVEGLRIERRLDSKLLDAATTLGRRAAERFRER